MGETKNEYAERILGSSRKIASNVKHVRLRKQEISKIGSYFHNTEFQKHSLTNLRAENVKTSNFFSILCSKPLRMFVKLKYQSGDTVGVSRYFSTVQGGLKARAYAKRFRNVWKFFQKITSIPRNDYQDEIVRDSFQKKELIQVIYQ